MSVQLVCDYCDDIIRGEHLTVVIPREMVPYPDGDDEMFEFHFDTWECLAAVVGGLTKTEAPVEDEPVPYVPIDDPRDLPVETAAPSYGGNGATHGQFVLGKVNMDGYRQPDAEAPVAGVTRDRQSVTIRRKS